MTYEVKVEVHFKNGKTANESFITEERPEFGRIEGLDGIKFHLPGKKRFTWVRFPNDYQMDKYYDSYECVIAEATTGRRIQTINR